MNSLMLALAFVLQTSGPGPLEADQFERVINGLYEPIKSVNFVYEGRYEAVGDLYSSEKEKKGFSENFQGIYFYRHDGSILSDVYKRKESENISLVRNAAALHRGQMESIRLDPDARVPKPPLKTHPGQPFMLDKTAPAQRLVFYSLFQGHPNLKDRNYVCLGFEEVDGNRCLKIKLNVAPGPPGEKKPYQVFWIDLERGGHPRKVELFLFPPDMIYRTSVTLGKLPLPGGESIWFPSSTTVDYFLRGFKYYHEPVARESVFVVTGSVRFNDNMNDETFNLKNYLNKNKKNGLMFRKEFDEIASRPQPPKRTDRASVEAKLAQKLQEADRQEKIIEASSAARQVFGPAIPLQATLLVLGAGLIIGAVYLRKK